MGHSSSGQRDDRDFTRFGKNFAMKVIKAFGNDHSYYTLPAYDGTHEGNIDAWIEAVNRLKSQDPQLHQNLLRKIFAFSQRTSSELDIISTLMRQELTYDVRVIWRRREVTLQMYSLRSVEK